MAKIEYLNSFDELTWRIDFSKAHIVRCSISWTDRVEIRSWFEKCCSDTVWIWNGTSTPSNYDTNWIKRIYPKGFTCYLIFEHVEDSELFLLKYADSVDAKSFGADVYKAWHDSRSGS